MIFEMTKFTNDNDTINTYDKIASQFSQTHFEAFWTDEFEEYKHLIKGKKVLDIGCGAGRDAVMFVKDGFNYTGIDASKGMLEVAHQRVPKATYRQMDFRHLDFADEEFDGFWVAASFLHVPKAEVSHLVNEAKRVIKPRGIGFISLKEKTDKEEGFIEENKYGGIKRYFAFYKLDEFNKILQNCGLETVKTMTHQDVDTNWLCYFVRKIKGKR